jgi:hypothetical protein
VTPALRHEWHQFQLLRRDSVRRLLDSILVSRAADPMLFALWFTTLAMTPPVLVAVRKIIQYPFLTRARPEVVEQIAMAGARTRCARARQRSTWPTRMRSR